MFLGGFDSNLEAVGDMGCCGHTADLLSGGSERNMLAGGLIGGAIIAGIEGTIANAAAVKDIIYTVITDLQILEKAGKGARVQQTEESNLA